MKNSGKNTLRRTIIFKITPQTHVRATQDDRIYFRIPRHALRPAGLKRLLRLERYNEYKISLLAIAKQKRFTFPDTGASIKFFIPVAASLRSAQKERLRNKFHQKRLDLDNLIKAFFDSLMVEDKTIAHFEAAKFWSNDSEGRIEVTMQDDVLE